MRVGEIEREEASSDSEEKWRYLSSSRAFPVVSAFIGRLTDAWPPRELESLPLTASVGGRQAQGDLLKHSLGSGEGESPHLISRRMFFLSSVHLRANLAWTWHVLCFFAARLSESRSSHLLVDKVDRRILLLFLRRCHPCCGRSGHRSVSRGKS